MAEHRKSILAACAWIAALAAFCGLARADINEVWAGSTGGGEIGVFSPYWPQGPGTTFASGLNYTMTAMAQVGEEVWVAGDAGGAIDAYDLSGTWVRRFDVGWSSAVKALTQVEEEVWMYSTSGVGPWVARFTLDGFFLGDLALDIRGSVDALAYADGRVWVANDRYPCEVDAVDLDGNVVGWVYAPLGWADGVADMTVAKLYAYPVGDDSGPCGSAGPFVDYELYIGSARTGEVYRYSLYGQDVWELDPFTTGLPGGVAGLASVDDYEFTRPVPNADFNNDGVVDIDDFVILKNHFGADVTWIPPGDANYDGRVDIEDFAILKNSFGQTVIPEPATAGLLAVGAAGLLRRRRRR